MSPTESVRSQPLLRPLPLEVDVNNWDYRPDKYGASCGSYRSSAFDPSNTVTALRITFATHRSEHHTSCSSLCCQHHALVFAPRYPSLGTLDLRRPRCPVPPVWFARRHPPEAGHPGGGGSTRRSQAQDPHRHQTCPGVNDDLDLHRLHHGGSRDRREL